MDIVFEVLWIIIFKTFTMPTGAGSYFPLRHSLWHFITTYYTYIYMHLQFYISHVMFLQ